MPPLNQNEQPVPIQVTSDSSKPIPLLNSNRKMASIDPYLHRKYLKQTEAVLEKLL